MVLSFGFGGLVTGETQKNPVLNIFGTWAFGNWIPTVILLNIRRCSTNWFTQVEIAYINKNFFLTR